MSVAKLRLWSDTSLLPSNDRLALFFKNKIAERIRTELKTYGRIEINKLDFKSVITANEAIVIPIANDPVLPTKILP